MDALGRRIEDEEEIGGGPPRHGSGHAGDVETLRAGAIGRNADDGQKRRARVGDGQKICPGCSLGSQRSKVRALVRAGPFAVGDRGVIRAENCDAGVRRGAVAEVRGAPVAGVQVVGGLRPVVVVAARHGVGVVKISAGRHIGDLGGRVGVVVCAAEKDVADRAGGGRPTHGHLVGMGPLAGGQGGRGGEAEEAVVGGAPRADAVLVGGCHPVEIIGVMPGRGVGVIIGDGRADLGGRVGGGVGAAVNDVTQGDRRGVPGQRHAVGGCAPAGSQVGRRRGRAIPFAEGIDREMLDVGGGHIMRVGVHRGLHLGPGASLARRVGLGVIEEKRHVRGRHVGRHVRILVMERHRHVGFEIELAAHPAHAELAGVADEVGREIIRVHFRGLHDREGEIRHPRIG